MNRITNIFKKSLLVASLVAIAGLSGCSTKSGTEQSVSFQNLSVDAKNYLAVQHGLTSDKLMKFFPGEYPQVSAEETYKKFLELVNSGQTIPVKGMEVVERSVMLSSNAILRARIKYLESDSEKELSVRIGSNGDHSAEYTLKSNKEQKIEEKKYHEDRVRMHQINENLYAIITDSDSNPETTVNNVRSGVGITLLDVSNLSYPQRFIVMYKGDSPDLTSEAMIVSEKNYDASAFEDKEYSLFINSEDGSDIQKLDTEDGKYSFDQIKNMEFLK